MLIKDKINVIKRFITAVKLICLKAIKALVSCFRAYKLKPLPKILKKLKNKKVLIGTILVFLSLILVVFIIFFSAHAPKKHKTTDKAINRIANTQTAQTTNSYFLGKQLEDIAIKLAKIQTELAKNTGVLDLDPIKEQIKQLAAQTQELSDKSSGIISKQIQDNTEQLKIELNIIKAKLTMLQQEKQKIAYLKPADLPFTVVSLDNIQQNNVVTVNYDYQTIPINIGDYLAGWKLINADFADQKAEFINQKNQKNQHVIVDLNHLDIQNRSPQE